VDVFRWGTAADGDALHAVTLAAFGKVLHYPSPDTFRVLERDGRIVSVAGVWPIEIQVGKCSFVKGDVGHVATHPDCQGQGYGSALMRDVVGACGQAGALRERGCQVSRLGGLLKFYARFGWVPFPRRYVDFPLRNTHAGATVLTPDEFLGLPPDFPGTVRPYDPDYDHEAYARLWQQFNHHRTGAEVRRFSPPPNTLIPRPAGPRNLASGPRSDLDPLRCVCEIGGEVKAYAFATEYPQQVTEFEAKVTIGDLAYDLAEPRALEGVLRHLLVEACRRGSARASARMPFDERIFAAMTEAGIGYQTFEIRSAPAGNMIQIVDLRALLERIAPELEDRLAASPWRDWSGGFALQCRDERVGLTIESGKIGTDTISASVAGNGVCPPFPAITLDQYQAFSLILGLTSLSQLLPMAPRDEAQQVLSALFPPQPTASGVWG
jgi:GNAT superfamily N-acetyltransferase